MKHAESDAQSIFAISDRNLTSFSLCLVCTLIVSLHFYALDISIEFPTGLTISINQCEALSQAAIYFIFFKFILFEKICIWITGGIFINWHILTLCSSSILSLKIFAFRAKFFTSSIKVHGVWRSIKSRRLRVRGRGGKLRLFGCNVEKNSWFNLG